MKRRTHCSTTALMWLLAAGCGVVPTPGGEPHSYPLIHMETTGITTAIRIDGKPVTIAWDPASDQQALTELDALKPDTFLALTTQGDGLQIVGTLSPELRWTLSGPGRPASEPYRSFTLHGWYVVSPFRRFVPAGDDPLDGKMPGPLAERLTPDDFTPLPDGHTVDPRTHQRQGTTPSS